MYRDDVVVDDDDGDDDDGDDGDDDVLHDIYAYTTNIQH